MRLVTFAWALICCQLAAQNTVPANWAPTGQLAEPRYNGCAVTLPDGRVLVAGGTGPSGALASSELYQSDGTFTPGPPMNTPRALHTCTLLADGRVFVAGGDGEGSAEIYDPTAETWAPLDGTGQLRGGHTATRLLDGRVLIAGGNALGATLSSLEIFDPREGSVQTLDAALSQPRDNFKAILRADGTVLFIGGSNADGVLNSTDSFDPSTDSVAPGPALQIPRASHSATMLDDGRILVAGGTNGDKDLDTAEIFDPAMGAFTLLVARMNTARRDHLAVFLTGNGAVLLAGGRQAGNVLAASELFQPFDNTFAKMGDLTLPRFALAAVVVRPGLVLAAGGLNDDGPQSACGTVTVPAIQFAKSIYRPNETIQIIGTNFPPATQIIFGLQLVTPTGTVAANSRLVTRQVITPLGSTRVGFSASIVATQVTDAGSAARVTVSGFQANAQATSSTLKIPTALTLNTPVVVYEGLNVTFLSQLTRQLLGIPMTALSRNS